MKQIRNLLLDCRAALRRADPAFAESALGEAEAVKLAWKPQTPVNVAGDDVATLMKLIDALEEDDDVQTVWGNYEISDTELLC